MNQHSAAWDAHRSGGILAPAITLGFGTTVAMWILGYLTHLPAVQASGVVTGAMLITAHVGGGFLAGRSCRQRGLVIAGASGLVTAAANLLVFGALLVDPEATNSLRPNAMLAVGGYALFSVIAAVVGALVARGLGTTRASALSSSDWLSRFAIVTVFAGVPVLLSGGLVTSTNTGLAVTDWPTSFGANMFLYPLARMTGGVYYEHAHRLFGSLVGLTTLTLLVFGLLVDRRRWMKVVLIGAFIGVCAQGVLGGYRVTAATAVEAASVDNKMSVLLAMVHGISAQLFFAFLCVIAGMLSARWRSIESGAEIVAPERADSTLRRATLLLLIAIVLQLSLGSMTRHFNSAHAAFTHTGFALIVLALAAMAGFRASGRHKDEGVLRKLGMATTHTVFLQLVLGGITLFLVLPYKPDKIDPPSAVVVATAHQAIGALLVGITALLFAWTRRLTPRAGA